MRPIFFTLILILCSCSSKTDKPPVCPDATETVTLSKKDTSRILGKVGPFLTDAQITQEHQDEGANSKWRFTNMPSDSVYYKIGLREGDAITKTNLGIQNNSINLISDLAGIPSGTTNCLHVESKDKSVRVIKILLDDK